METTRIQLLMQHQTNRRLLEQWLSSLYDVTTSQELDASSHLIILDDLSLRDYEIPLHNLKQELAPIFFTDFTDNESTQSSTQFTRFMATD